MKQGSVFFIIALIGFLTVNTWAIPVEAGSQPTLTIGRSFGLFTLGAKIADLNQQNIKEQPEAFFGQGPEEKRHEVLPSGRPPEVYGLVIDFYQGTLFRIRALYKKAYTDKVSWKEFTREFLSKLGEPRRVVMGGSEVLLWDDGSTRLLVEWDMDVKEYSLTLIDSPTLHQVSRGEKGGP